MTSAQATSQPRLRVSEVFVSLQGEGPLCCRRAVFLRLQGCNLRCPWCDTSYSLDPRGGEARSIGELVEEILSKGPRLLVVTGGEPLLQRRSLNTLLEELWAREPGFTIQVETNGTLPPPVPGEPLHRALYVVSPKDVPIPVKGARTHPGWIRFALETGRAWFKLLVRDERDATRAAEWARRHRLPGEKVYLMPLTGSGDAPGELLEKHRLVARLALRHGLEFSPRIHLLLGLA